MANHRRVESRSVPAEGSGPARTIVRAALVSILALALAAPESEAANRRACQRTCKRFTRQCTAATSKPGRCERLLRRVDKCRQRFVDVACGVTTTTTTTSSTTTTTIAGAGVVVAVDEARAATRTVPTWGGTLTATGADGTVYSLTIPSGALLDDTAITMTPIVSISGGDLPSATVFGVDLQPSGLRLYEFADLRITPPQLDPTANVAGFSYEGEGEDLHRYPAAVDGGRILLHVIHFSGAGANICVELCPPPIVQPPSPPITESQLEQLIAQLDPHDPFYAPRLTELLHGYYELFIKPDLARMQQDCDFAKSRIPKALAWSRTNQVLLNEEGFEEENQTVGNALVGSASNCWSEVTAPCFDVTNAYQVEQVTQMARQAQLLGGDPDVFDPAKLRRCSGLWSGTVTWQRKSEQTGDIVKPDSHEVFHHQQLTTSTWEIKPNVIAEAPCYNCESRMYEATWRASVAVDVSIDLQYGDCRDTSTAQDQYAVTAPSAILITVASDRRSFNSYRPTPGSLGAPPLGQLSHEFEGTRVPCSGNEQTFPIPVVVMENFGWPWGVGVPGQPLERTDPTVPWTTTGQHVTRNETTEADGSKNVLTDTWSWTLTLEPDGGQ
jgi:hypothetical protein